MNEHSNSSAPYSKQDEDEVAGAESELSATRERFRTIYCTIRERIALLDYLPGERLSEVDLADEFGVSRTPVRRVLARLEAEGLLESRHGVGTFVTTLDMAELRDIYRLRKELASLTGMLSPKRPTPDVLEAMTEIQNQCRLIASAPNPKKAFARINIAFFNTLMQTVGNKPLRQTLELLFYRTARMWPALTSEEVIIREADIFFEEIRDTIRALAIGDMDSAAHLRRTHISLAFTRLESYVADGAKAAANTNEDG